MGLKKSTNRFIYKKYIKRPMDFVLSLLAIIILSPVFLGLSVLVKIKLGSPFIFSQKRPGLNEKIFTLYKFRTMTDEKDENGNLFPDSVRLTKFGKILRSTSLDELPELFNILKGDMSIVGPRPLLVQYLDRYSSEQRHRHDVRPGLTGYAQTKGRNLLSWEDKFYMDVWYTQNVSFLLDVNIILKTIGIILKRKGVTAQNSETMDEFIGN